MKSKKDMTVNDWDAYYATKPDESARRLIYRKLVPLVDGTPSYILDVGCAMGDGLLEFQGHFPNAELYGLDYSLEGIVIAETRLPYGHFYVCDLLKDRIPGSLCWHTGGFIDLVLCVQTLEHFRPDQITWVLAQLLETTTHQLIISVPYGHEIPDKDHKAIFHEDSFDAMQPDVVKRDGCHLAFSWIRARM